MKLHLAQNTVHALESWNTTVTVTTPEDIGALTAKICFAEPRIVNTVVYTAGDTVTYGQLADIVDSVLSHKVRRFEWTVPELQKEDIELFGSLLFRHHHPHVACRFPGLDESRL